MKGFFASSEVQVERPAAGLVPRCGACGLYRQCESPKMEPYGRGRKKVLVVGEAPGLQEDEEGRPFIGKAGQMLRKSLAGIGVDLDRDAWTTNALICFVGDTRVETLSPLKKVFRRSYSGTLITIKTLLGRTLTGSPNHPILTSVGWVSLGLLKEGENVICYSSTEWSKSGGTNIKNPPSTIQQVFESAAKSGNIQRMVGSSMDFHGDGEDGYVDVVIPNGNLRTRMQSESHQHLQKIDLIFTGAESGSLECKSSSNLTSSNLLSRSPAASESQVSVLGQQETLLTTQLGETEFECLAASSYLDFPVTEKLSEMSIGNMERFCNGLKSLSGNISMDRIVDIKSQVSKDLTHGFNTAERSCHIYNLETEQGYYTAGGIIVKNCHPPKNATPDEKQIDWCRPNLLRTLDRFQPQVVITLGRSALASVLRGHWRDVDGLERWVGWQIPIERHWLCPTYHPSFLLRMNNELMDRRFSEDLQRAFAITEPPPLQLNWEKQIEIIYEEDAVFEALKQMDRESEWVAVDYETNCLKPEYPQSRIYSCAVSNGKRTVSYPWQGKAIEATGLLLRSKRTRKIACNLKFEEKWTRVKLGHGVCGWGWDTMIAAHCLDNRPGITSIKFQSFVQLGVPSYNDHIEPYLSSRSWYNRIQEIEPRPLLIYGGMDAILEYRVAMKQRKEMGFD